MERLRQDVRFGIRLLVRTPGVLVPAVLALALGIGANSAVFSVVYGVLFKPLPFPEPDRLVAVYDTQPTLKTAPASYPKYVEWRDQNHVFDAVGGWTPGTAVLTGRGDPERVKIARATASLFRVFRAPAIAGRWFREDEDQPGGPKVVLLAHGFWQRRFGADQGIIGRTITLDDVPRTVVGVMSPDFSLRTAEAIVPLAMAFDEKTRGNHFLSTFARLKAGVSVAQAQREMVALGRRLAKEHFHNHGIDVRAYREVVIGDARLPLLLLFATVAFVLLIACANVANILLARATTRRHEMAVRSALGAGRARLARQLLTESVLLSLAGGLVGLGVAWAGVRAFVAFAPPVVPRMATISLDVTVVLFTLGLALVTGITFGLAPALQVSRQALSETLKQDGGRTAGSRATRRAGNALVVVEVSLAFVLLAGAGLMLKSLVQLEQQDVGFVPDRVLAFDVALPASRYDSDDKIRAFYRDALEGLSSMPGVVSVGATSGLPLYNFGTNGDFSIEGKSLWKPSEAPLAEMRAIGGEYFKTLGIPLVRGRLFTPHDVETNAPVAVINRAMAERFWPNEDPIGKRISIWTGAPHEIVGIVGSVRTYTPASQPAFEVSCPLAQKPAAAMTIIVRAKGEPTALTAAIRRRMATLDPHQPLSNVQTMEEVVAQSLARPRLFSALTAAFAGVAAILALIGVYSLISYAVSQQIREFAIRIAMGADAATIVRLVLRRGMGLAIPGIAIGVLAALGLTRLMRAMLYQVEPTDPVVIAAAAGGMSAAAFLACYLPARGAARVDPVVILKAT
jgi:putative ABC transport system permease protein